MSKEISYNDYLKALGLFTLATEASKKVTEYERALCELLGVEEGSHVQDAIWCGEDLDAGLKREKISVNKRPSTDRSEK